MVYQWKSASRIRADVNASAEVMNQLAERNALTAENLVEVSRPIDAPLHNEFEWDNNKAADEYRKAQARNIINALVIVPDEQIPAKEPVRAYFKIEQERTYTQLTTIMSNPTRKELLLKTALSELSAFQRKYATLEELTDVMQSIESALIMYS